MVIDPTVDDAIGAIAEQIRTRPTKVRQYGYDVYLPRVWNLYAIDSKMVLAGDRYAPDHVGPRVSPTFILLLGSCAEGVFCGPVSAISRGNLTAAPDGYSITPTDERWLASDEPGLHIPTERSWLAAILTGLSPKFGPGFVGLFTTYYGEEKNAPMFRSAPGRSSSTGIGCACARFGRGRAIDR